MRLIPSIALFVIFAAVLPAQEDAGAILGRVTDNTGSIIPGAVIRVVHGDTGVELKTVTNDTGNYLIVPLPPGTYKLMGDRTGFKHVEVADIVVSIQHKARIDLVFEVGGVQETISVTASAPALVTDDTTLGQVVDNNTAVEIPLLNRNVAELSMLGPGMTNGANGSINGIVSAIFTGSIAPSANGMRPTANQYSIDGGNVNVGFYNYPAVMPIPEAIGEAKTRTGDYSAEFGGFGGAQIDYSLRSGGNRFHGGLFEFLSNDKLNARNAFALTAKPIYKQNQFGGIFSGPVVKNKTFFMMSYQGLVRREQTVLRTNVPSLAQRQGDLRTDITGRAVAAFRDPTTGTPFAGNQIPTTRFSPTMARVLQLYPAPNLVSTNNFTDLIHAPTDINTVLAKFDQNIGQDRISVHYSIQNMELLYAAPTVADFGLNGKNRGQNAGISGTHIFTPATILDARISWNRHFIYNRSPRNGSNYDARKDLLMEIPSSTGPGTIENGVPAFSSQSFATVGDVANGAPLIQPDEVVQLASGLTTVHGRHSWKFGGDLRHTRSSRYRTLNNSGIMAFNSSNPAGSGYDVADMLLGLPNTSGLTTNPITVDLRGWRADFYALDNWNVSPKVTLNLGVRYEFNFPLTEPGGRIPFFNMTAPGSFTQQPKGEQLFDANYLNFAPRLGLAYRFRPRTVFRAAYGVFFSAPKLLSFSNAAQNPPLVTQYSFSSSTGAPLIASRAFPIGVLVSGGVPAPVSVQRDGRTPYVQTWSANIQQAIGRGTVVEIGYVGNHAVKMFRTMNLNVPPPGAGAIQTRRPLPNWGAIQYQQADAMSNYNGLQTRIQRRFASGISLIGSYTFAKAIDLSADEQEGTTIDPSNLNRDRGLSDFNQKHRLTITYVWQLPFGKGKPWLRSGVPAQVAGGWQFSGVTTFARGTPLSVNTSATPANSGLGISRPNRICDGNLNGEGNRARWIDTSCFLVPANFFIGNSGRNIIIGPGNRNWNMGISRTFRIHEQHAVFFRAEMFNAFNHTNLGIPALSLGSANFGQINNSGPARRVQMALKYNF